MLYSLVTLEGKLHDGLYLKLTKVRWASKLSASTRLLRLKTNVARLPSRHTTYGNGVLFGAC